MENPLRIYVSWINPKYTEYDVKKIFEGLDYGSVERVDIWEKPINQKMKNYKCLPRDKKGNQAIVTICNVTRKGAHIEHMLLTMTANFLKVNCNSFDGKTNTLLLQPLNKPYYF
jgi:hypothetical protein